MMLFFISVDLFHAFVQWTFSLMNVSMCLCIRFKVLVYPFICFLGFEFLARKHVRFLSSHFAGESFFDISNIIALLE